MSMKSSVSVSKKSGSIRKLNKVEHMLLDKKKISSLWLVVSHWSDIWLVDSVYTDHMTSDKESF